MTTVATRRAATSATRLDPENGLDQLLVHSGRAHLVVLRATLCLSMQIANQLTLLGAQSLFGGPTLLQGGRPSSLLLALQNASHAPLTRSVSAVSASSARAHKVGLQRGALQLTVDTSNARSVTVASIALQAENILVLVESRQLQVHSNSQSRTSAEAHNHAANSLEAAKMLLPLILPASLAASGTGASAAAKFLNDAVHAQAHLIHSAQILASRELGQNRSLTAIARDGVMSPIATAVALARVELAGQLVVTLRQKVGQGSSILRVLGIGGHSLHHGPHIVPATMRVLAKGAAGHQRDQRQQQNREFHDLSRKIR